MGQCISMDAEELERRREKRRMAMEVVSAEAKASQLLSEMPGRLCSNGATQTCCLHSRQGSKGINQDSMLAWEDFASEEESVFCGVFDGHGPNGHMVASKVRDCLPSLLTLPLDSKLTSLNYITHNASPEDEDVDDIDNATWIHKRFTAAFHKMDEHLKTHPKLSCMSSGSTAVAMLLQGNDLVVGSVGDSRAILVRRQADGSVVAHQLTVDLKPDSPGEVERIKECQGRVFALEDEPHIPRLWLPHANTPGLAMSRAFGDFCLKDHGLIATPHITHQKLTLEDEFIVLATDGVWDVLSNNDVMNVVLSCSSKEDAAKCVVEAAITTWKQRNLASRIDDCAVVCHFLKNKLNPSKVSKKLKPQENIENVKFASLPRGETNRQLVRYDTIVSIEKHDAPNSPPSSQLERGV